MRECHERYIYLLGPTVFRTNCDRRIRRIRHIRRATNYPASVLCKPDYVTFHAGKSLVLYRFWTAGGSLYCAWNAGQFLSRRCFMFYAIVTGPGWFPTIIGYCMSCMLFATMNLRQFATRFQRFQPVCKIHPDMQILSRVAGRVTGSGTVASMSHGWKRPFVNRADGSRRLAAGSWRLARGSVRLSKIAAVLSMAKTSHETMVCVIYCGFSSLTLR